MPLEDFVAVYARSPEDLPSDDELAAQINALGERLKQPLFGGYRVEDEGVPARPVLRRREQAGKRDLRL